MSSFDMIHGANDPNIFVEGHPCMLNTCANISAAICIAILLYQRGCATCAMLQKYYFRKRKNIKQLCAHSMIFAITPYFLKRPGDKGRRRRRFLPGVFDFCRVQCVCVMFSLSIGKRNTVWLSKVLRTVSIKLKIRGNFPSYINYLL